MNEWCIYIALYCVLLYTQRALQSCWRGDGGGWSLLNHHQCAASTWMMRSLPQNNSASALTTHQLQMEYRWRGERVIEPIKLGCHDWQGSVEGIWPEHRGFTPTLYEECHGSFNDHRESGPLFNVSSERRCFFTVLCPCHYTGALGPTQTAGWAPLMVSLTPLPTAT